MAQRVLIIVNDAPYGTGRAFNALRLASALQDKKNNVRLYLTADGVYCGVTKQEPPPGFYNIGLMLTRVISSGGQVGICEMCMAARGIESSAIVKGVNPGSMELLADWTAESDKVLVF